MVYKAAVLEAFQTLGLDIDATTEAEAGKAYKKLALLHHPDRNHGDPTAVQRFQKIGSAWELCLKHYKNPASSHVPDFSAPNGSNQRTPYAGRYYSEEEEVPLDEEEQAAFFQFIFEQMMKKARFSYENARQYRKQRSGADGGGVFAFRETFAQSQQRQEANAKRQAKEREEYLRRVKEFEEECAAEQRENDRRAAQEAQAKGQLTSARISAFSAARKGQGDIVKKTVEMFNLDVNAPERDPKMHKIMTQKQKAEAREEPYETLLHAAACSSSDSCVTTMSFLLSRGGNLSLRNKSGLTPFHVSILRGNVPLVRFFLAQRPTPEGCHHSKAAGEPDGRTPLRLAVASGKADLVSLLLHDATVHDVENCFDLCQSNVGSARTPVEADDWLTIRDTLSTKKGFAPPEGAPAGLGKKALRKLAQAKEEAALKTAKAQKLAEENARAVENVKRKQERAAKRAEEEREKAEEANRQKLGEEAERKKAEAILLAQRKAEAQARWEAAETARQMAEIEAMQRREEKARLEEDARRLAEMELAARTERERQRESARKAQEQIARREIALRKEREAEATRRGEAAKRAEAARRAEREEKLRQEEAERVSAEALENARIEALRQEQEELDRKLAQQLREEEEYATRLTEEQRKYSRPAKPAQPSKSGRVCKHFIRGRCVFGDKCHNLHPVETPTTTAAPIDVPAPVPSPIPAPAPPIAPAGAASQKKKDKFKKEKAQTPIDPEVAKRRAEQSARDKERIRRQREERANQATSATPATQPYLATPSTTPSPSYKPLKKANGAPKISTHSRFQAPSPPLTPVESFQTVAIPDDLFPRENASSKKKAQSTLNRDVLEQELARREREIAELRAQLARR